MNKQDYWIEKHKEERIKSMQPKGPDIGTYKNNYPVSFKLFGKLLTESDKKQKNWDKEERFSEIKRSKSNSNFPGPGQY